jgi:hypothetical protein
LKTAGRMDAAVNHSSASRQAMRLYETSFGVGFKMIR